MGLRKRLARVEQALAAMEEREGLANCICKQMTLAIPGQTQELEAELNQTCPAHGILRFGRIMRVRFDAPESAPESEKERHRKQNAELDEVLARYHARLAAAEADSSSRIDEIPES